MPPNNLRELAKQGNPKVIAQIINHSLQKKGIKVDVVRSNTSLEVTLESEQVADRKKALVEFIRNGMDKLAVESINKVTVYGVPTGQSSPVWEEEIILAPEGIPQAISGEDPLYATDEAETALETDEDYQTEPPDDLSEDEDELFDEEDEEDELNSEGDFEEESEGDFEGDSEGDFEEESEGDFEEDSEGDFEEGEYEEEEEATPAKKKLPILAIVVPLLILVPVVVLAVLHFTGIFRLPFLGGSQTDSSTPNNTVESPAGSPSPAETSNPPAQGSPSPSPEEPSGEEIWNNARSTAYGAAVKAGEAQTRAEWNEVASEWQKAIDLMKDVPESNSNYETAQQKAEEYQNNLNVAKQRAAQAPN